MLLKDREILAVGTWPASKTLTLDEAALDGIVSAFNTLNLSGRVPLKLGHDGPDVRDDPTTQFAMGWVKRIYRAGARLLADMEVPEKVAKIIDEGFLKFVSVELLPNVQAFNRTIPWVLDAVALLGTDQPAVGILKDLKASIMARRAKFRSGERVTLKRESANPGEPHAMTKEEVEALLRQHKEANDAAIAAAVKKVEDAAATRLAEEQKGRKEDALKFKRQQITDRFEVAIKAGAIEPKVREKFTKLTGYDAGERASDVTLDSVDEFIKENSKPVKASAKPSTAAGGASEDDAAEAKMCAADRVVHRARKLCFSRNQNPAKFEHYNAAVVEVLKADPELGEAYKRLDDAPAAA